MKSFSVIARSRAGQSFILARCFVRLFIIVTAQLLASCTTLLDDALSSDSRLSDSRLSNSRLSDNSVKAVTQSIPVQWTSTDSVIKGGDNEFEPYVQSIQALFDSSELSLLIDEALLSNPDINSFAFAMRASKHLLRQHAANRTPALDLTLNKSRSKVLGSTEQSYDMSLNVSWDLDFWGRFANEKKADEAMYMVSSEEYKVLRNLIAAQLVRMWIHTGALYEREVVEGEYLDALKHMEMIGRENYIDGNGQLEDLTALRVQVAQSLAKREMTRNKIESSHRSMALLIGKMPSEKIKFFRQTPRIHMPPQSVPAVVIAHRPDIQAVFYRLQSTQLQTKAAHRALLPSLQLTGNLSDRAGTMSDLWNGTLAWALVGGLTQPLFHGGRLIAELQSNIDRTESEWWKYKKVVLVAIEEVENSLALEQSLTRQYELLYKAEIASKKNVETVELGYRNGANNIFDLINSQLKTLELQEQLIEKNAEQMDNRIVLALALGIGVE